MMTRKIKYNPFALFIFIPLSIVGCFMGWWDWQVVGLIMLSHTKVWTKG